MEMLMQLWRSESELDGGGTSVSRDENDQMDV